MKLAEYKSKTGGASGRADVITAVELAPHPADPGATRLRFLCGREAVCASAWIAANNPATGGYFVVPESGAAFMTAPNFLRDFALVQEATR